MNPPRPATLEWMIGRAEILLQLGLAYRVETYQRPDRTVTIPEVLRPYMGRDTIS